MHSLIFGKEGPPPSSSVRVLMRFTAPTKNPLRARRRVGGQMPPSSRTLKIISSLSFPAKRMKLLGAWLVVIQLTFQSFISLVLFVFQAK